MYKDMLEEQFTESVRIVCGACEEQQIKDEEEVT
tara:strand:- start:1087 stop:1188 length:102 start_codon:yes stop_codon:yes gene_type:complete